VIELAQNCRDTYYLCVKHKGSKKQGIWMVKVKEWLSLQSNYIEQADKLNCKRV
jgi:hypothetical protein